jgi:hypothetical protein
LDKRAQRPPAVLAPPPPSPEHLPPDSPGGQTVHPQPDGATAPQDPAQTVTVAMRPGFTEQDLAAAEACFAAEGLRPFVLQSDPPLLRGGSPDGPARSRLRQCLTAVEHADIIE